MPRTEVLSPHRLSRKGRHRKADRSLLTLLFGVRVHGGVQWPSPRAQIARTAATWTASLVGSIALGLRPSVALLLMTSILMHELGHLARARWERVVFAWPVFALIYAWTAAGERPRDAAVFARIALAGPVTDGLLALVAWGGCQLTGWRWLGTLAVFAAASGLVQLLPLVPLDGARALDVLGRWTWVATLGFTVAVGVLVAQSPAVPPLLAGCTLVVVLAVLVLELAYRFSHDREELGWYHRIGVGPRILIPFVWLGLLAGTARLLEALLERFAR